MLAAIGWNPFIDKINGSIDWIDTYSTSTTAVIVVIRYFMDAVFVMRRSQLFKPD